VVAMKKDTYSGEGTIYTYAHLEQAAEHLIELSEREEEGNYYTSMMALVSTAFMLEAFLNHLGDRLFPFWRSLERSLSPTQKLEVIASHLKLKPEFGSRSYQSFRKLFEFRNLLAHGKTQTVKNEWKDKLDKTSAIEKLQAKWEKLCNPQGARRCHEDAKKILHQLWNKAGQDGDPFSILSEFISDL